MAEEKKIGRYIIEGVLGEGAMGCVYKAHDPNLERAVAVKTMRTGNIQKEGDYSEFKERFFLESRANGSLNHPNIVAVYDSGIHGKDPYLVMEYIKGKPLDIYMESLGEQRLAQYLKLLTQIGAGLDYAHEEGVVHRDIKPGNILVTTNRGGKFRAKLVDFGLAKLKDSKITQTGFFLGTPSYASPEQVLSGKLDLRSDLFSFGIVAYEMLTGELPFDGESLHSILYKIANDTPAMNFEYFSESGKTGELETIFKRMLQKDPDARYQSASDFVEDLKEVAKPLEKVPFTWVVEARSARKSGNSRKPPPESKKTSIAQENQAVSSMEIQVRELRSLFKEALRSKNVDSSRYCYKELKRLGVNTATEREQLKELRERLSKERKARQRKERTRLVHKSRNEFILALKTRNLESVRYCLGELARLKVDVTEESRALAALEKEIDQEREQQRQREEKQRLEYIEKRRGQLQDAFGHRDLDRCGKLLKELGSLLKVDVSDERKRLATLKEEVAREREIAQTRSAFNEALLERNLRRCRGVVARLEELGAEREQELQALKMLKHQLAQQDQLQLKERIIKRTRDSFREALQTKNLESCRYYLRELSQLVPDVISESRAMESLVRLVENEEAIRLKEAMVRKLRIQFRQALDQRQRESCEYYIKELTQLGVDTAEENRALQDLIKNLSAEDKLADNMIQQIKDRFQQALDSGDETACRQHMKMLGVLGADTSWAKKAMEKKKRQSMEAEQAQLKERLEQQFRGKFAEGYRRKNRDTCRYYIKELLQLGADVSDENKLLQVLEG